MNQFGYVSFVISKIDWW